MGHGKAQSMHVSSEGSGKDSCLTAAILSLAQERGIETVLVEQWMEKCEIFREICADYEECCAQLVRLERKSAAASRQVRDYVEMRDQLERELLRYLEAGRPRRGKHGEST